MTGSATFRANSSHLTQLNSWPSRLVRPSAVRTQGRSRQGGSSRTCCPGPHSSSATQRFSASVPDCVISASIVALSIHAASESSQFQSGASSGRPQIQRPELSGRSPRFIEMLALERPGQDRLGPSSVWTAGGKNWAMPGKELNAVRSQLR
jgi:hypothetical protein